MWYKALKRRLICRTALPCTTRMKQILTVPSVASAGIGAGWEYLYEYGQNLDELNRIRLSASTFKNWTGRWEISPWPGEFNLFGTVITDWYYLACYIRIKHSYKQTITLEEISETKYDFELYTQCRQSAVYTILLQHVLMQIERLYEEFHN